MLRDFSKKVEENQLAYFLVTLFHRFRLLSADKESRPLPAVALRFRRLSPEVNSRSPSQAHSTAQRISWRVRERASDAKSDTGGNCVTLSSSRNIF